MGEIPPAEPGDIYLKFSQKYVKIIKNGSLECSVDGNFPVI